MTQEPRPMPELLWCLEYLRKWHGQPEPIHCVKWFESERAASLHRADIANGKGEIISMAKYVAVDPAYFLPDPPRTLTPEQVERARDLLREVELSDIPEVILTAATMYGAMPIEFSWIRSCHELLREVVGDE